MTRREAREAAFLLLFEWSFREDETVEEIIEMAKHCRQAEIDAFATMLASSAVEHVIAINDQIERHSDKWKLGRLSRVTLAVLRMGVCELAYIDDIPAGATINEAVELMKKYATEDEAAYVNGVLGAFHRSRETGAEPAAAAEEGDGQPAAVVEAFREPAVAETRAAAQAEEPGPDGPEDDMISLDDIAAALDEV